MDQVRREGAVRQSQDLITGDTLRGKDLITSSKHEAANGPVRKKQLLSVENERSSAFRETWEHSALLDNIFDALWRMHFPWRSIGAMQYGYPDDPSPPIIVCVAVQRGTLTTEASAAVTAKCRELLDSSGFPDVGVDVHERDFGPGPFGKHLPMDVNALNPCSHL